jgi:hypothetical protein
MTIVQMGFPSPAVGDAFAAGFGGVFERLERLARDRLGRGESRS